MNTIILPDGYIGGTVECDCEPILIDGNQYKLKVKDKPYIKWCSKEQWQEAMTDAYQKEMYESYLAEYPRLIAEEYKKEEIKREIFGEV